MAKSVAKAVLRQLFGDYCYFKIFAYDLEVQHLACPDLQQPYGFAEIDEEDILRADEELIREQASYAGAEAWGFGIYRDDRLVCVQWLWYGERYKTRNFWPLQEDEAKSVQLVTVPSEQGKGLATKLKQFSARRLREHGFTHLYSRIWWNNYASIRVSEKAGWRHIATVIELYPFGKSRPWRLVQRKRTE